MPILVFFLALHGHRQRRMDVAQHPLFHPGHLRGRRHSLAHADILNMCIFGCAHGGFIYAKHRYRLHRSSHAAPEARGQEKVLITGDTEDHRENHEKTRSKNCNPQSLSPCFPVPPVVNTLPLLFYSRGRSHSHRCPSRKRPAPPHRRHAAPSNTPAKSPPSAPATMGKRKSQEARALHRRPSQSDQVEDDAFTADTVEGKFAVRNIIAKFSRHQRWHHRHPRPLRHQLPLRNIGYVGANDGGSSTAIPPRVRKSAARFAPGRSATATASGSSGPTAKKPSENGLTPTASTARAI